MKKILTVILSFVFLSAVTTIVMAQSPKGSPEGSPKGSPMKEAGGSPKGSPMKGEAGDYPPAWAKIKGTSEGSAVSGKAKFYETEGGIKVVAHVSGVTPPGKHGFHIHENGSCDDGGKAAGGHYNPHGVDHGFLPDDGAEMAHAGDMGNIEIDEEGDGLFKVTLPGLSLEGENGILGKSVILHEKEDDFGQPTGNAGGRIGCGIIVSKAEYKEMKGSKGSDHHDHGSHKGSEKGS